MSGRGIEWRQWPYLATDEVAAALRDVAGTSNWSSQKLRRWIKQHGAAVKVGATWFTTADRMRDSLLEVWEHLVPYFPDDAQSAYAGSGSSLRRFSPRSWPVIHTDEVADALNHGFSHAPWTSQKVRRWLRRAGAGTMRGAQLITTKDQLRERLPDMWEALLPRMVFRADE